MRANESNLCEVSLNLN